MPFTPRMLVRYLKGWFAPAASPRATDPSPGASAGEVEAAAVVESRPALPPLAPPADERIIVAVQSRATEELEANLPTRLGRSTLKIVVAGDGNVGKTSLIRRYAKHKFSEVRNQTLGIDITTQEFTIGGRDIALVLWDIEGQRGERPFFYYGANAALLVYDVTTPGSLDALDLWAERVRRYAPPAIPILVAGNKVDLPAAITASQGEALAARLGAQDHLLLSARTEQNVTRTFNQLAELAFAPVALR